MLFKMLYGVDNVGERLLVFFRILVKRTVICTLVVGHNGSAFFHFVNVVCQSSAAAYIYSCFFVDNGLNDISKTERITLRAVK